MQNVCFAKQECNAWGYTDVLRRKGELHDTNLCHFQTLFFVEVCGLNNSPAKHFFSNRSQISNIWSHDAQIFNVGRLWTPFGTPFSIKLCDQINLVNCSKYEANTCFYFSGPHFIASTFHHNSMFLLEPLLEPIFSHFMLILWGKGRILDPFNIQWDPKWLPKY